jgi:hypothetical protein
MDTRFKEKQLKHTQKMEDFRIPERIFRFKPGERRIIR